MEAHLGVLLRLGLRRQRAQRPHRGRRVALAEPEHGNRHLLRHAGGIEPDRPPSRAQGRQPVAALETRRKRKPGRGARGVRVHRRAQRGQRMRLRLRREVERIAGRLGIEVQQVVGVGAVEAVRVEPLDLVQRPLGRLRIARPELGQPEREDDHRALLRKPLQRRHGARAPRRVVGQDHPGHGQADVAGRQPSAGGGVDGRVAALHRRAGQLEHERRAAAERFGCRRVVRAPAAGRDHRCGRHRSGDERDRRHEHQPPPAGGNTTTRTHVRHIGGKVWIHSVDRLLVCTESSEGKGR